MWILIITLFVACIIQHFQIKGLVKGIKLVNIKLDDSITFTNSNFKKLNDDVKDLNNLMDDKNKALSTDVFNKLNTSQSNNEKKFQQLSAMMKTKPQKSLDAKPSTNNEMTTLNKRVHLTEAAIKELNSKVRK